MTPEEYAALRKRILHLMGGAFIGLPGGALLLYALDMEIPWRVLLLFAFIVFAGGAAVLVVRRME